ncbi:CDP-glucose 4,6-dehydratase [Chitinophagaceae bacterium IBVUCB2]|nr:CDP-glucose 4,6-dehydratase [Chitinophagaceae bacterium IBVUCB2]
MENLVMQRYLSYYNGKKVFITGHTGFKGSWLLACLHQAGSKVKGYALKPEYDGLFNLLEPLNMVESVIADIRDKQKLQREIESFQPDFIFHLAAQPLVRRSYEIPAETFDINVVGTANLLEAVTNLKSKCTVIVVTTDKVYDNKEQDLLYNEDDTLGGYDPYSASKACTELVVNSFRNSFFNISEYEEHKKVLVTARAGNVIGGGDWSKDRIIPDIVRSLQNHESITVRSPKSVRPWQHVLEPLSGYLQLGMLADKEPLTFSKAYNFGPLPNDHLTVQELVENAIFNWGNGNWSNASDSMQPHEAGLLKLDISRAKKELSWEPKLSASEAIEWTVSWYKKPVNEQVEYSFQQIKNFFAL